MPSPKNHRKGSQEKARKVRPSSHDSRGGGFFAAEMLPKTRTLPELFAGRGSAEDAAALAAPMPKLTKLLLNVTIQRSLGAVRVVMPPEATAGDLITAALRQYEKEARLPLLRAGASGFDLHYSQFSLERLDREEKLVSLGSRNFFLFPKKAAADAEEAAAGSSSGAVVKSTARCSNEADSNMGLPWLRFMEFSL